MMILLHIKDYNYIVKKHDKVGLCLLISIDS